MTFKQNLFKDREMPKSMKLGVVGLLIIISIIVLSSLVNAENNLILGQMSYFNKADISSYGRAELTNNIWTEDVGTHNYWNDGTGTGNIDLRFVLDNATGVLGGSVTRVELRNGAGAYNDGWDIRGWNISYSNDNISYISSPSCSWYDSTASRHSINLTSCNFVAKYMRITMNNSLNQGSSDGSVYIREIYVYGTTIDINNPTITFIYPNQTYQETYNNYVGWINFTTNKKANTSINDSRWTLHSTDYGNHSYRNTNYAVLTDGKYSMNISAWSGVSNGSTILNFTLDTTLPTISTNLTNNYIKWKSQNISANFSFSDNIMLWGWNATLNGYLLNRTTNWGSTIGSINYLNNSLILPLGKNNYSLTVFDAHTALETSIKETDLSKVGDSLKVSNTIATSLSAVDKITYLKELDRYTFCYYPKTASNIQKIQMPTDCYYQNREDMYKGWFVCPNNNDKQWWDFESKDDYNISVKDNIVTAETKDGKPTDKFCFNSVGTLNVAYANYSIWVWNDTVSYLPSVIESSNNSFTLTLYTGNLSFNSSATFNYNNTLYATTEVNGTDHRNYSVSVLSPSVSADTNVLFWFNFTFNQKQWNSSFFNQTVKNFFVTTGCTGNLTLLNLSLRDEETKAYTVGNESTIELDLKILKDGVDYLTYYTSVNSNNLTVCMTNASYVWSDYSVEFIASYVSTGYVKEFYYLDNGDFNNNCSFNSYTSCHIDLYDLLSADSTTFLFKFFDESGLSVDDSIIHTYRKYIGDGLFREVERSKEDNNGETHIHLVEEDVIYYFMVTQYGDIVYTSDNYNAKCLSSPCSIELSATADFTEFPTNWNVISNVSYNIVSDKATRLVTASFVSDEHISFNVSVYKYNNNVATLINGSTFNGTSGSVVLHIPTSYGNATYFVVLYKNSTFLNSDWINFNPTAKDLFGSNGLILGALLVMAVGLMCVSEGVILIIGVCLALLLIGVMFLIDISWLAIISIICAGSIVVWKMVKK